ncbi:hypothetical protein BD324DRAFT_168649 [Kockovaella imperatae]|uniref:Uncharacterized protein n=1 Tax=Kockovaella imperatae TaxID=4999 RepID=A0A1Y1U815_9TREE|nr:hypothetical protein BD324DRAFT_168649 [Kockovaella imperatae]ORX34179.1 hypothetical protein BD324DRAFT_168649 [Kockovaella imperatae]
MQSLFMSSAMSADAGPSSNWTKLKLTLDAQSRDKGKEKETRFYEGKSKKRKALKGVAAYVRGPAEPTSVERGDGHVPYLFIHSKVKT